MASKPERTRLVLGLQLEEAVAVNGILFKVCELRGRKHIKIIVEAPRDCEIVRIRNGKEARDKV